MPNLDNIHFKFFPKSKTASMGKKLIYFAWFIEILVASMAFSMAMLFIFDAFNGAEDAAGQQYEVLIMGLAFGAVTLMELTKIPLATAFYYGALWQWRTAFFLALIFVNFSTFETMIQGFEMAYATRSNEVDVQRKVVLDIENQINKLDTDLSLEEINAKILPIKDSINEIESEILQIDRDLGNQTREYASIRSAAETAALNAYNASMGAISESEAQSGKGNIQNWTSDLQRTEDERKEKEKIKKQLEKELDEIGTIGLGLREKKDRKKASITEIKNEINDLKVKEKEIKIKIEKSNTDLSGTASASRNQAENIYKKAMEDAKSQYDLSIEPLASEAKSKKVSKGNNLKSLNDDLQILLTEKTRISGQTTELEIKQSELRELLLIEAQKYEELTGKNQIYRIAHKLQPVSAFFSSICFWCDNDEVVINQTIENENKIKSNVLTQAQLDAAFWIWFGTLAFVISIIGTLVAFAGLHLQDERMHTIRNKPIKAGSIRKTIRMIPFYLNKILWSLNKRLRKPVKIIEKVEVEKIVDKIIEVPVEVEKVVEKIVEKPVIEEKVVFQKVEVPKEVVRKEIIYVPLPTDDPEILKKGPYSFTPDIDKDKK